MLPKLEHTFQKQVKGRLKSLPSCWHFTKEALAIRGIPDIIGVINGRFFALELKRSEAEASKKTGRIVLQRHVLGLIKKAGGIALFCYPENLEEVVTTLHRELR